MDCSYFRERINQYVDGELGYLEVAELQAPPELLPGLRRGARPDWASCAARWPTGARSSWRRRRGSRSA